MSSVSWRWRTPALDHADCGERHVDLVRAVGAATPRAPPPPWSRRQVIANAARSPQNPLSPRLPVRASCGRHRDHDLGDSPFWTSTQLLTVSSQLPNLDLHAGARARRRPPGLAPSSSWRPTTTRYSAFISRVPSVASLWRSASATISARQSRQRPLGGEALACLERRAVVGLHERDEVLGRSAPLVVAAGERQLDRAVREQPADAARCPRAAAARRSQRRRHVAADQAQQLADQPAGVQLTRPMRPPGRETRASSRATSSWRGAN